MPVEQQYKQDIERHPEDHLEGQWRIKQRLRQEEATNRQHFRQPQVDKEL